MLRTKELQPQYPAVERVCLQDDFFLPFTENICKITVPDVLAKFEKDGAIENYRRIAAGERGGHNGYPWFHGLICETLRGLSDLLLHHYDKAIDDKMDEIIEAMGKAMDTSVDGYFNPYTILQHPECRFGRNGGNTLGQHETYNPGCLAEAGVHHYRATGKKTLLAIAVKNWNYMCDVIGEFPKKNVTSEHSIAEEALVKLAELFDAEPALAAELGAQPDEYLRVAKWFIDSKGRNEDRYDHPKYLGEYSQDHRPAREQREAVGHAVRAALFYTGMATVARVSDDQPLAEAAKAIYENIVTTKMHANGCVGAHKSMERFGNQYDLPNNAYLETCAGVAMVFFEQRLFQIYPEARIFDELETTLCNVIPASLSETFDHYTYENPLQDNGKYLRWEWHKCPCCPPMLLKCVGMLPQLIYATAKDRLYINLHVDSTMDGVDYTVQQNGKKIIITPKTGGKIALSLYIRVPHYARHFMLKCNGKKQKLCMAEGYAVLNGVFGSDDEIAFSYDTPIVKYEAHPFVKTDRNQVMIKQGATLYCAEGIDNPKHVDDQGFLDITLSKDAPLRKDAEGRIVTRDIHGKRIVLIPYHKWNNRGAGALRIWLGQEGLVSDPCNTAPWEGVLYRPYCEY